jgi:hypothetical protein
MKRLVLAVLLLCSIVSAQTKKPVQAKKAPAHKALKATAGVHTVTLTWLASAAKGVTGYNVYRGTTAGGENYSTPVNSTLVNGLTFTDSTVSAMTQYFYTAKAFCPTCTPNASVPSNEVTATTPGDPQPDAPVLSVGTVSKNSIPLFWNTPVQSGIQIESTNIYRCVYSTCPGPPKVATVVGNKYTDTCTRPVCYYRASNNVIRDGKQTLSPRSNIVTAKTN